MKKSLLTLVAILITVIAAHSQIYIGWSEKEIRAQVKSNETLRAVYMPDGTKALVLKYKDSAYYIKRYYMDKKTNKCFLYIVEPTTKEALTKFKAFCDKNYNPDDNDGEWFTSVCLKQEKGKCVFASDVEVKLKTVKGTNTKMFYFIPTEGGD